MGHIKVPFRNQASAQRLRNIILTPYLSLFALNEHYIWSKLQKTIKNAALQVEGWQRFGSDLPKSSKINDFGYNRHTFISDS